MTDALLVIFSGIVALSTGVYAALTWRLVAETRKLREAQFEPNVIVYVQPRDELINWLDLIVENTGMAPAYNVRLTIEPDMDRHSGDMVGSMGWFTKGIRMLAPRQQLRQWYTTMLQDFEGKASTPRTITVSYVSATGKERRAEYVIDLAEMRGMRQLGTPPLHSAAKSLEKIASTADHLASGWSKLRVITKTAAEERAETEAWLEEIKAEEARKAEEKTEGER